MAALFAYRELHIYVVDKLAENVGSFLSCFLDACQRADSENFEIIKPALERIRQKYPLRGTNENPKDSGRGNEAGSQSPD